MSVNTINVGVIKLGAIASAPLLDLMFDERAERDDINVRGFTSGAKMDEDSTTGPVESVIAWAPHLVIIVSPNAALPGPSKAREMLAEAKLPTVSISDGPAAKAFYKKNEEGKKKPHVLEGQGFIVIPSDSMIGAKKEFLDPTEMTLFNADAIKVLSITGVIRAIQNELDILVAAFQAGETPEMPKLKLTTEKAVKCGSFKNPYAKAKAIAALTISEAVAEITTKGCFKTKEAEKYIPLVAAGHEMMRVAAILSDEVRELEKAGDSVARNPHVSKGKVKTKTALMDKPK
ncbi:MAG: F420-dependent methylenetetrahydromethanopterin dehydrogenase [Candidatus Thorarchaeota archaeon]|jgi:methylenetetrahydromethanopterin dehydrogenase